MGNGSACPEKLYLSLQPWTCPKNAWASFTKFWKIKHHAPNSPRSILEISTSKIISNACCEVLTVNHKQGYKINKTIWPTVNWFYTYCNALLRGSGFADARFLYAGFRYTRFLRACFPYALLRTEKLTKRWKSTWRPVLRTSRCQWPYYIEIFF